MAMITDRHYTAGFSGSLLQSLAELFNALAEAQRMHHTLRILGALDDHTLRDIGLMREDLIDLQLASSSLDAIATMARIRRRF